MAFRIQIRRDTAEKWVINNPILLEGEIGYETDTTYIKIGDGTTYWNDLPYWNGGVTGAGLVVKEGSVTVLSPTNTINFSNDFNVTATSATEASISLVNGGGGSSSGTFDIFVNGEGVTGATGLNFTGFGLTASGKYVTLKPYYTPYFSVTALLDGGGNFSSFYSSRGPNGEPLTGPNWNYTLANSGNNVTITHNTGAVPIGLATHGSDGTNISVNYPFGASNAPFGLYYPINKNSFTVTGIQSGQNTGAAASNTIDIIWTFGSTL
jgi:hypothetical protein